MATFGAHCKRLMESHGREAVLGLIRDSWAERKIRREDIHLRELAESTCGPDWHRLLRARFQGGIGFRESQEAVDASAFADITGQLLIQNVHEQYQAAPFVFRNLIDQEQITNGNLGPQREPWLSKLTTGPSRVNQGMPYPASFFGENYIDYPQPEKWGQICRITFEMIFSDLTKQAFDSAGNVGERIGIWEEEQNAAVVFGLSSVTIDGVAVNGNNHIWNGTAYNTYQTSAPWVNQISGLQILDWTQLNQIEQLFVNMLDPQTGKPIQITPNGAVIQPFKWYYWKRLQAATTRDRMGSFPTSGATNLQTEAQNPLDGDYPIYRSKYAYQLLLSSGLTSTQAQEYAVVGDFKKAIVCRYVYKLQVVEAPPQNPEEFNSDIVFQVKGSIYQKTAMRDPRYLALAYNT